MEKNREKHCEKHFLERWRFRNSNQFSKKILFTLTARAPAILSRFSDSLKTVSRALWYSSKTGRNKPLYQNTIAEGRQPTLLQWWTADMPPDIGEQRGHITGDRAGWLPKSRRLSNRILRSAKDEDNSQWKESGQPLLRLLPWKQGVFHQKRIEKANDTAWALSSFDLRKGFRVIRKNWREGS